ncbi:MAG: hypothetical protein J6A22_03140 [Bacteroidales bacterium]|nr:hypothetical protein [Bacteroidales bacterium]
MSDNHSFSVLKHICAAAFTIAAGVSCSDIETVTPSDKPSGEAVIDEAKVVSVTATTAKVSVGLSSGQEESEATVVVYYSDAPVLDIEDAESVTSTKINNAGRCTVVIDGLRIATTYRYQVYVVTESSELAGETGEFNTNDIKVTLSVDDSSISSTSAVVSGTVTGMSDVDRNSLEFGISVSGSEDCPVALSVGEFSFQASVGDLNNGTEYKLTPFIRQHDAVVYGEETLVFTTKDGYSSASKNLDMTSAVDLSLRESANSYIVPEKGLYKFKALKGYTNGQIGDIASCTILWESFGTSVAPECCDLISAVCYKDGYIAFQTSDPYRNGNAVIAAMDSKGRILWSWHIWFTETPKDCYFATKALMDRNLGATSVILGDPCSLGLLYQWGRKDPFLNSSVIDDNIPAKSTIAWPDAVKHDKITGTIGFAVSNPTVFIGYNLETKDWQYNQDDTRWRTVKTEYDPCPPGYKVPDGGPDGVFKKAGFSGWFGFNPSSKGIIFASTSPASWFPASGFRYFDDGSIGYIGVDGYYWSSTPSRTDGYYMYFNYGGYVDPAFTNYRSFGFAVRCQKK